MRAWMINSRLYIAGAILGGIAGYFYWQYVGCSSGSCAITSKPFNSVLYFAFMGAVFLGLFQKKKKT